MYVVTNSDFKIKITIESIYVRQGSDTRHMRALLSVTDVKLLSWGFKMGETGKTYRSVIEKA